MFPVCVYRTGRALSIFIFILALPSVALCATPEEDYKKIQEEMFKHKKEITEAQKHESSVLNEIEYVNKKLGKIEAELRILKKNLNQTETEIISVNSEISTTQSSLEKQKDWIKRKLRIIHKFGYSGDIAMMLLSAKDISQMIRIWKYLENIIRFEHKTLGNYRQNLKTLDEKYKKLQVLKTELSANKEKIRIKENEITKEKQSKELILASVRNKKASHQKMLSELNEASKKLLELIKESSKTDTYSAAGFPRLKGRLSWPADGKVAISYGAQKDPQFNTPVFRNGIHIRTNSNSEVRSVYSGKVIFSEWFKGFGQLIIINHGSSYHTLYGNLSEIFSHVGDIIKENHVIGKVGTSGMLNAPGLYFEIRYKGKPLDPTQWLKRKGV